MPSSSTVPANPRDFAVHVVQQLRAAGYEALWAGGCVRDQLLGVDPKDYDVATNATPQQVIDLFGKRRTVPVGVSFGVVMVLGPNKACGQVEVATFRADGQYLDGRRPSEVTFCSAEEDAKRRDFTINGMFYDPVADRVLDYVGGRKDLEAGIIRAIGDATARYTEDKLRTLRAVRFSATYDFQLEDSTAAAIRTLRADLKQVSAERIAQELRRMLAHSSRAVSVRNLHDVGLLEVIFPSLFESGFDPTLLDSICQILDALQEARFEPSLVVLLSSLYDAEPEMSDRRTAGIRAECRKLKLSNEETSCIAWLADNAVIFQRAGELPLHVIKPLLADARRLLLLDVLQAGANEEAVAAARSLNDYLTKTSAEVLNPPPLIDGEDLMRENVEPGPEFKRILTTIRQEQLDELLHDHESAMQRARELL